MLSWQIETRVCPNGKIRSNLAPAALPGRQSAADNPPMNIGPVLYALRREKGLTLEATAFEAGVDPGNLSRIEKGTRQPSIRLLERLAEALGTRVSSIFASAEGDDATAKPPKELSDITDANFSSEALEVRQRFRDLSPTNQRIALELIRTLSRIEKNSLVHSP